MNRRFIQKRKISLFVKFADEIILLPLFHMCVCVFFFLSLILDRDEAINSNYNRTTIAERKLLEGSTMHT